MRFFRGSKAVLQRRDKARRRLQFEPLETRTLLAFDLAAIVGTAYVDLTGDGLTPDDTRIPGATVELYRDDGDGLFDPLTDTLLGSTTTDGAGQYRLASPAAGGTLPPATLTPDNYFVRQLPVMGYTPPAAALVTIVLGDVAGATVQVVDTFDTTQQIVTADPVTPTASSSVAAAEALGGERDVLVTHISGAGEVSILIDQFNSNLLAFASSFDVVGTALIQYDGPDGDPVTLNPTGLGGVNMSDSSPQAGLLLATRGDASGATAVIRLYSDGTNYSSTTISIPDQPTVEQFFVPFSAFVVAGGVGANFASIGAIEFEINGVSDLDATVTVLASLKPMDVPVDLENLVPSVAITKFTNGSDANTPETGPYLAVGATATFTYEVQSTGGTPLQNVVVTDDNGTPGDATDDFSPTFVGGDTNGDNVLDPGEVWIYQATRVVTAGPYANVGSVTAEDSTGIQVDDSDPSHHFGVLAAIHLVKATNGQDANAAPGPYLAVGDTATFTYTITNLGNVALDALVLVDDNGTPGDITDDLTPTFVGGDTNSNGRLDLTETWTYQATRVVTVGQHTNIATVTAAAVDDDGLVIAGVPAATGSDPSHHFGAVAGINILKATNGEDANTAPGPTLAVGSTATFTYTVTNTGNVPLANLVVRDDNGTPGNVADDFNAVYQGGDTNSNGLLDLTETWIYQATRTVTAGQHTNVGTVTADGVDPSGGIIQGLDPTSDNDPSNHFGVSAGINVVKSTNGQDANTATGPLLLVGSTATFTYVVTNTGTTALGSVTILDDNGTPGNTADDFAPTFQGGDTNGNGRLDVGETWTYQATRTVTLGQHTNIATVTGQAVDANGTALPGLQPVSDTDPSNHLGITTGVNIVKSTNGDDANTAPGPVVPVGDTVTFTYVVTNTGTVALADVAVVDDNGTAGNVADDFSPTFQGGDTNGNGRLDTGETWTYQATRTATAGQYTNVATVRGNPVDANGADIASIPDVTDTDASNHFGFIAGIGLQKLTNGVDAGSGPGPTLGIGSIAVFTYRVTNTGNIALTHLTLVDDNGTPGDPTDDLVPILVSGDTNGNNALDVTETWVYQATRAVTAGAYTNTATVRGEDPAEGLVTATDTSAHTGVTRLSKRQFLASRH